jgi:hypothetical protein
VRRFGNTQTQNQRLCRAAGGKGSMEMYFIRIQRYSGNIVKKDKYGNVRNDKEDYSQSLVFIQDSLEIRTSLNRL